MRKIIGKTGILFYPFFMEVITLKNFWSIIRENGFRCFRTFLWHRMCRHEKWIVHQFHS